MYRKGGQIIENTQFFICTAKEILRNHLTLVFGVFLSTKPLGGIYGALLTKLRG